MDTLIGLIARFDVVFYFFSALGILVGLRGLSFSRRQRKVAAYGLEKEAARNLRRRSLNILGTMLVLVGAVYALTNIIVPGLDETQPLDVGLDVTPGAPAPAQASSGPTRRPLLFPTVTPTFGVVAQDGGVVPTPAVTLDPSSPSLGCEIVGATISQPLPGEVVSGQVEVHGEANILNFAAYKFEVSGPTTGGAWATVGNFTVPVASGFLGNWDATSLEPGSYRFRLVLVNTSGNFLEPCVIPITIATSGIRPSEATPLPQ